MPRVPARFAAPVAVQGLARRLLSGVCLSPQDEPLRKTRLIAAGVVYPWAVAPWAGAIWRVAAWAVVLWAVVLWAAAVCGMAPSARADVRIKDIADVDGIRENQLIGYGLVVGLNGTGDKLNNNVFTRESLVGMLERLGVNTRDQVTALSTKNLAAVMVTAELPAFARNGSRVDITVSALGDATNLTGGTLLVTPLLAADGDVYAVAQGALSTGAISARGAGASITRGVPTAGRISNGATVEKEVPFRLGKRSAIRLGLRNPDLTTAQRVAAVINRSVGPIARVSDPRTVALDLAGREPIETLAFIEKPARRARQRGNRRHRRGQRHHRHGRQRADQHGRHRAGQPDHPRHRDARGQPAERVCRRVDRGHAAHQHPGRRSA